MSRICKSLGDVTFLTFTSIIISSLGPFQYGFHLAELNAPHDLIVCSATSVIKERFYQNILSFSSCIHMTVAEFAFLSSIFVIGGFIGAITAGQGSSIYGRLKTMQFTNLLFTIGSVLQTLANSVLIMSIGRFLIGLGAGAATVVTPLYISEMCPPKARGLCGTITQVMICFGILSTQILGCIFRSDGQWRFILLVGTGLGILHAAMLLLIPESPAWVALSKNPQLAKNILQSIRSAEYPTRREILFWNDQDPASAEEEPLLTSPTTSLLIRNDSQSLVNSNLNANSASKEGVFAVLCDPLYRPAIIAVVGVMFAQQLSGINSINFYSVSLLRGILPTSSLILAVLISTMNVVTTILCAPLVDCLGRKSCLLLSIAGMGSMSLVLATSLVLKMKILAAVAVVLFVGFFATGLGPVPFILPSELVGLEAASATQSWGLAGNYLATFLVAQFFPMVNNWLNSTWGGSGWIYFGFAAMSGVNLVFVAFSVPESKGKSCPDEVWGRVVRSSDPEEDI